MDRWVILNILFYAVFVFSHPANIKLCLQMKKIPVFY